MNDDFNDGIKEAGLGIRARFERVDARLCATQMRLARAERRARLHSILTILFAATVLVHAAHDFGWL